MLELMYEIRYFEEKAEELYMRGMIHGTMHLSVGEEASAVGSIALPLVQARKVAHGNEIRRVRLQSLQVGGLGVRGMAIAHVEGAQIRPSW